jgi:hypothetical protein
MKIDKIIKITLSLLFFLCLLDMPYGFYQFARFTAMGGFVILAYLANEKSNKIELILYGSLALLFQPFFKIALGRQIWNIVDVIVGVGLVLSLFVQDKKK